MRVQLAGREQWYPGRSRFLGSRAHVFPYSSTCDIGTCGTINGILQSTARPSLLIRDVFFLGGMGSNGASVNRWCPRFHEAGTLTCRPARHGGAVLSLTPSDCHRDYSLWASTRLWNKAEEVKSVWGGEEAWKRMKRPPTPWRDEWDHMWPEPGEKRPARLLSQEPRSSLFSKRAFCVLALESEIQASRSFYRKYRIVLNTVFVPIDRDL